MKINPNIDLGKAFESLKKDLIDIERESQKAAETVLDSGIKYARAYGRLSAAVQCHIAANTDTSYLFLRDALKTPENSASEAPTLLLYEQLNWDDDIPDELFCKPNLHP